MSSVKLHWVTTPNIFVEPNTSAAAKLDHTHHQTPSSHLIFLGHSAASFEKFKTPPVAAFIYTKLHTGNVRRVFTNFSGWSWRRERTGNTPGHASNGIPHELKRVLQIFVAETKLNELL